jgi:hypothetical protein
MPKQNTSPKKVENNRGTLLKNVEDGRGTLPKNVCNNFMYQNCNRENCIFLHDNSICFYFWKNGSCKFGTECKKNHNYKKVFNETHNQKEPFQIDKYNTKLDNKQTTKPTKLKKNKDKYNKNKRIKNTESFIPIDKNTIDMRMVLHTVDERISLDEKLTEKDVLLVPDLFKNSDIIYDKLLFEIQNSEIPENELFKLWHGDSHIIADDKLDWKTKCPSFNKVISKIKDYFNLDIKATRFNWYKDTSQFKPMHFDSSAVKPHMAKIQNFTLAVSFGATRDVAFEKTHTDGSKTIISLPQPNGHIYAFCKDTNINWRHGVLQDIPIRNEGRISIICWGWINT